jgi:hypothetical protein
MPAPFAAIENLVNQRAVGMLANAEADFGGGLIVSGVFDASPVQLFDVVDAVRPQFRCLASLVATVTEGDSVTINAVSYKVANVDPDGTGMTTLVLK